MDENKLAIRNEEIQTRANSVMVTLENLDKVEGFVSEIQAFMKEIDNHYDDLIKEAHLLHKKTIAKKAFFYDPLKTILDSLQRKIIDFRKAEEEKRKREEERIRKENEEKIRVAREKAEKEMEIARAKEKVRLEEEAMKEAAKFSEIGDHATADLVLETVPEPVIEMIFEPVVDLTPLPVAPKTEGVAYIPIYKAKVVNLMELVKAISEGRASLSYIEANMTALNSVARAQKKYFSIPGVVCEEDQSRRRTK